METTLNCLKEGQSGCVTQILLNGALRQRLVHIGLIVGTKVQCIRRCPSGSPILYCVRGSMVALRSCDGKNIRVAVVPCR